MQEPYIIPSIMKKKRITFIKESGLPLNLCDMSMARESYPRLNKPFFTVDVFQKQTKVQEKIIIISLEDLKKLGFYLTARPAGRAAWLHNQRVIYSIELKTQRHPRSKTLGYIPKDHKIQKDINNDRVRLLGINAGVGGASGWMDIDDNAK